MGYKDGETREQISFGMCLDDFIGEEHMCRVIDAFCDSLDAKEIGFKYAQTAETGCHPYDPKDLLKLYLYGYLNCISSSGRLAREATRNVEVMWLLKNLRPSKRTMCYFKENNRLCLKKVFRNFNAIYRDMGLFGREVLALDSVKIRANNSRKNNHNAKTIEKTLKASEERIEQYLALLDKTDETEGYDEETNLTSEQIRGIIEKLTAKKEKYEKLKEELNESGAAEISTVDPDSRLMRQGSNKGLDVSYNTQAVADSENKMIVDYETTNKANDKGNLEIVERAKAELGIEKVKVLLDTGFYDGEDILTAEKNGTTCIIPKPAAAHSMDDKRFWRENFIYDKDKNVYICPTGAELKYMRRQIDGNGDKSSVYANYAACTRCPNKAQCTKSKDGRQINRKPWQDDLDKIDSRYKKNKPQIAIASCNSQQSFLQEKTMCTF